MDPPVILRAELCPHIFSFSMFAVPDTHAILRPTEELEAGEYTVTVWVTDSGSPAQSALSQVNVTACLCDSYGDCRFEAGAFLGSRVGISFIALIIIIASGVLLLGKCSAGEILFKL